MNIAQYAVKQAVKLAAIMGSFHVKDAKQV
jgi:hypothetical protein